MSRTDRRGRRFPLAGLALLPLALLPLAAMLAHATPPPLRDFEAVLPLLQPERREELQQRAQTWMLWTEARRNEFEQRAARWDALTPDEQGLLRERYLAAQALPPDERARVREAAQAYAALPPERQQALRAEFDALDRTARRGWLLGPELGADYPALQPLLAQVPADEHDAVLQTLRAMTPRQRQDLAVLVQRTPPTERARLRSELVSTAAASRDEWLQDRLHR